MKKIFSIILAVAMAAVLTVSATAAPSPTSSGIIQSANAVDGNNNPIQPIIADAPPAIVQAATNSDTLRTALGTSYQEGMRAVAVRDVTVPPGTQFPVTLTFTVPGVDSNSNGVFLHWNGTNFDTIPATFAGGGNSMTGTFNSLSPVVIVLDSATATAIEQVYGYDPSVDPKSPQTGIADMTWIYVVSALCLCGSAVAFTASRKKPVVCCQA